MSGIVLSSAIRSNLLTLQNTADLQATVQTRLATGKKVNSALDNATSFFTAASFTNRAGALGNLLDSMSNGIQTIKAASTGIDSISKLIDNLQSTARQARQAPVAYSALATYSQSTALSNASSSDLRGQIYTSATTTPGVARTTNGTTPITGGTLLSALKDSSNVTQALAAGESLTVNGQTITVVASGASGNNQVNVGDSVSTLLGKIDAITGAGTGASSVDANGSLVLATGTTSDLTIGGSAMAKLGLTAGTTARTDGGKPLDGKVLTVTVGNGPNTKTANITFSNSLKSLNDLNDALAGVGLTASLDANGKLTVSTTNSTASQTFTLSGQAASTLFGADVSSTQPTPGGNGATQRDAAVTAFNGLLSQIDSIAKDASFNGVNLLNGDTLSVIFNESNTTKLDIKGVTFTSGGLGLNTLNSGNFNDNGAIDKILSQLDTAKNALQSQASQFGSNNTVVQTRQDFTKQMVNTLQTGADNLTLADTNEEAANLLALNTRQQLSQSALSMASQAAQSVLKLFG